jgi:hypothetical protein
MVSKADTDKLLSKLQSYGETGRASRIDSQERINEETNRQIASLTEAVTGLLRHQRQGVDWETVYRVPETGTAGDFASVPAADALTRIYHNLDYTPSQWVVVRHSNARGRLVHVAEVGGIRVVVSNARYIEFQFDSRAIADNAVFHICLFRSQFIPREDITE